VSDPLRKRIKKLSQATLSAGLENTPGRPFLDVLAADLQRVLASLRYDEENLRPFSHSAQLNRLVKNYSREDSMLQPGHPNPDQLRAAT
jgi:hypothetical protein